MQKCQKMFRPPETDVFLHFPNGKYGNAALHIISGDAACSISLLKGKNGVDQDIEKSGF